MPATAVQSTYVGPLPPPAFMDAFERVVPGAAERILKMAEEDQANTYKLQQQTYALAVDSEKHFHGEYMAALWLAFAVCVLFGAGGVALVLCGYEKIGATMLGSALVAVATSILNKRRRHTPKIKPPAEENS